MDNLDQKIKEFVQAIKETKEYQAYKKAADIYNNDKAAQKLLSDFQMARQTLDIFQQGNFPGQDEQNQKVENLLKEVRKNSVINEWIQAQRQLQDLIGGLATALSDNIDFPFTLPEKGCGCGG